MKAEKFILVLISCFCFLHRAQADQRYSCKWMAGGSPTRYSKAHLTLIVSPSYAQLLSNRQPQINETGVLNPPRNPPPYPTSVEYRYISPDGNFFRYMIVQKTLLDGSSVSGSLAVYVNGAKDYFTCSR